MSYGQPPARTAYGDQDFIKEDWPAGGPPSAPGLQPQQAALPAAQYPGPAPTGYASQHAPGYTQPGFGPSPGAAAHGTYGQQLQTLQPQSGQFDARQLAEATYNLTPEDQIFMRSWRRDSFYQRVLPMAVVFNGAYYYYNRSRQLPHKSTRYLLVTVGAYALGKFSFKNELVRRAEASPSQSPFMTSLRAMLGIQRPISGEFSSDLSQDNLSSDSGFGSANAPLMPPALPPTTLNSAYTRRAPPPPVAPAYAGASPHSVGLMEPQPYASDAAPGAGRGDGVPMTSYEELRARNRGLIQK